MLGLRKLLALPAVYRAFQFVVGKDGRREYVRRYLRPEPGSRVFDIGCGPGDLLNYLPEVRYCGIDLSAAYVRAAQKRYGARGEFRCEDVADAAAREPGAFDLVTANGVLHHLDDVRAARLLALARELLRPGGRFVSIDACLTPEQSLLARWVVRLDRGRHIRDPGSYRDLARSAFSQVTPDVRHDLIRIPYTHCILECVRGPADHP
jgi:SAM-dependent methyltransferase